MGGRRTAAASLRLPRTHDYIRYDMTTLSAALDVQTGQITGLDIVPGPSIARRKI